MSKTRPPFSPWADFPSIYLYMDQLLSLAQDELASLASYSQDPLLTASMINNYVKQELLPAPIKKRYNRAQLSRLLLIVVLKQILPLQDIKRVLEALDQAFDRDAKAIYECFLNCFGQAGEACCASEAARWLQLAVRAYESQAALRKELAEKETRA